MADNTHDNTHDFIHHETICVYTSYTHTHIYIWICVYIYINMLVDSHIQNTTCMTIHMTMYITWEYVCVQHIHIHIYMYVCIYIHKYSPGWL